MWDIFLCITSSLSFDNLFQGLARLAVAFWANGFGGYTWLCVILFMFFSDQNFDSEDVLQVPGYAMFKLWSSVISPFVLGRSGSTPATEDEPIEKESTSKRQEKLRKRSERGDPRVRTLQR